MMESSPLAIKEVDLESRVVLEPSCGAIFGWTREEMLGRPGAPMCAVEAARDEDGGEGQPGEGFTGYQTVRGRKDGTLFEVMIAAARLRTRRPAAW